MNLDERGGEMDLQLQSSPASTKGSDTTMDVLLPRSADGNGEIDDDNYEVLMEKVDPEYEPPHDQVVQYAEFLGFDLEEDSDLLWIARKGLKDPFPEEWKILRRIDTAKIIYFNTLTGQTSEDDPRDIKYREIFALEKNKKVHASQRSQASPTKSTMSGLPNPQSSVTAVVTPNGKAHNGESSNDEGFSKASPGSDWTNLLTTSGSFRRPDLRVTSSASSMGKGDHKGTAGDLEDHFKDNGISSGSLSLLEQRRSGNTRAAVARSSLSEDDAEGLEEDGDFKEEILRRHSSAKEVIPLSIAPPKPEVTIIPPNGLVAPLTTSSAPGSASSTTQSRESRESRHREMIKKIEAEITVLREDIVETRKFADAAAARAQQAHADLLKAEARARLAEEEQARMRNELAAALSDGERRRQTLKQELDDVIKRLIAAEDGRDAAERKARQLLIDESSRVKHIEREMELLRARLARALREKEHSLNSGATSLPAPVTATGLQNRDGLSGSGPARASRQSAHYHAQHHVPPWMRDAPTAPTAATDDLLDTARLEKVRPRRMSGGGTSNRRREW